MQSINFTIYGDFKMIEINFGNDLKIDIKKDAEVPAQEQEQEQEQEQLPVEVEEQEQEQKEQEQKDQNKKKKTNEYSKAYYYANRDKLCEYYRQRYQQKKALKKSVIQDDTSVEVEEKAEPLEQEETVTEYDCEYYQENKERIATRQQTDEAKAKFREQYHNRRKNLTPEEIAVKNAIAVAQRKVREAKLKAKYPGMKLKHAKATEKASRVTN